MQAKDLRHIIEWETFDVGEVALGSRRCQSEGSALLYPSLQSHPISGYISLVMSPTYHPWQFWDCMASEAQEDVLTFLPSPSCFHSAPSSSKQLLRPTIGPLHGAHPIPPWLLTSPDMVQWKYVFRELPRPAEPGSNTMLEELSQSTTE